MQGLFQAKFQGLDDNGDPLSAGLLYTYIAGTSTNKATYSDHDLQTANANPVVLDGDGLATVYGNGKYKFVLKDSSGATTYWTMDNIHLCHYVDSSDNLIITSINGNTAMTISSAGAITYTAVSTSGALTAGGAFTSLGIDDNASATQITVEDTGVTFAEDVIVTTNLSVSGNNVTGLNLKAALIESPSSSEDITWFYTDTAITVKQLSAVLRGSSTPSVTWTVRHNSDRNATGAEVVTSGTTTTSVTTGDEVTSFNDATIPANSWVWIETTAQSGTVNEINITMEFTEDAT